MSQGFVLDIPLDMLDRLDTANAKLTQLAAASERTMDRVKNSFNKMSTEGVAPFIQKLVEAKNTLSSLGTTTVTFTGINKISSDSVKAIDDVSRLAQSLNQLGQSMATSSTPTSQIGVESIRQTIELTKEMRKELSRGSKWFEKLIESADAYAQAAGKLAPTLERAKQAQREFNEEVKKYARQNVSSLIDSRGSAKTLNELKNYARELKATMNNLDPKTAQWQKLNEIYKQTNSEIKRINDQMREVNAKHKSLINTADQLKRAFALIFSVSAIKGYVAQIARVRGEFELQQRSLQAILQNKDEANRIWQQTVQLAVQSPFQVKELVTYTKQLAAYRVESSKLFNTTKMLADVSAGLGVDMQRLILAFGQVKAANYLRGTELRQFSEAGINILGELAKYFTEIEGTAVSVGDVFERVSKRMVTFADVEEIFKRITREGGIFYNMQEIQAETLRGQISNLRDSIDIMLNDIGKANEHILKGSVGAVKAFVENWRLIVPILKTVVAGFTLTRINALLTKDALVKMALDYGILASSATKTLTVTQLLNVGFKNFTMTIKGAATAMKGFVATNPILAAITAVLYVLIKVGNVVREHKREVETINKKYQELGSTIKSISNNFSLSQEQGDVKGLRKELNQLIDLANREYNMNIKFDVTDLDASELAQKFIEIREKIFDAQEFAKTFELAMQKVASWKPDRFDIFGDLDSAEESVLEQFSVFRNAAAQTAFELEKIQGKLSEEQVAALNELKRPQQIDETQFEYVTRLREAYSVLLKAYMQAESDFTGGAERRNRVLADWARKMQNVGIEAEKFSSILREWSALESDAQKEFDTLFDSLESEMQGMSDEDRTFHLKTAIDKQGFTDIKRELAYYFANLRFNLNIKPTIPQNESEDDGKKQNKDKMTAKRISLLKEMYKEYEKLNKTFDKTVAKEKVIESYTSTVAEAFKDTGLSIKDLKFDSLEGLAESLKKLTPLATEEGENAKIALERAISGVTVEIDIKPKQEADKEIKKKVEDLFSRYDITLDLDKLGLSKELMQSAFEVEPIDLTQLRKTLEMMKSQFVGTDMENAYKQYLEKIQGLEEKAAVERAKTYVKYLLDAQRDAVKIKMDEMRKLQEIEKSALSDDAKASAKERVRKDTQSQLESVEWADFKSTEMYTMMFEDLEYYGTQALENLRDKLGELRESLKNLPANEVKEIVRQMEKINEVTMQRNPFAAFKDLRKQTSASGKTEEEAQQELIRSENRVATLQEELDIINIINSAKSTGAKIDAETQYAYDDILVEMEEQGVAEQDILAYKTKALSLEQKNADTARKTTKAYKDQRAAYTATLQRTNDILGEVNNAVQASMELMEALGVSGDSIAGILVNSISSMISLTMSAIQFQIQLQATGVAANSALGIIGWLAIAIQAVVTAIATIFKAKDKALQNQIDTLAKSAEITQESFDKLANSIDEIYSSDALAETNKEMEQLNRNLIANLKAQKALQQERKQTDEVKEEIENLNDAILEAEQAIVDAQKDIFSHATDGILDSAMDAARGFVDAWADAYAETGNGMKGLEEDFEEMLMNMAKQQAAQQIVGVFADQWKQDLEKYINKDDVKLTKDEAQAWAEEVRRTFPELNAALEGYLGAIMDNVGSGSLSGLQQEIGSMSESTAEILVAYINSLRYFVAENNAVLKQLRDYQMGTEDEVNPMLAQLRIIARQTGAIHTLLDSVTRVGHPQGGSGIRVFMD